MGMDARSVCIRTLATPEGSVAVGSHLEIVGDQDLCDASQRLLRLLRTNRKTLTILPVIL